MKANTKRHTQATRDGVFWIASALFLLSGATGLAYEVIWFKRLSHVWGNSTLAMAAVVASFLLGLGLGAHMVGRFADRVAVPLRWYGVFEIAIGLLALIIPYTMHWLLAVTGPLYAVFGDMPLGLFLARSGLTFLIIGPPCFLMGGTLPLLVRQFTPPESSLAESTGWLYAINTLGASAGCYFTGFHILPSIGLVQANVLTASLNLAIGAASLLVAKRLQAQGSSEARTRAAAVLPVSTSSDTQIGGVLAVYAASAITGTAALLMQMTWARQLAVMVGGSTYAFTATLFVFLVAIALGSLIYHSWVRRLPTSAYTAAAVIVVLAVATLAGRALIPALTEYIGAMRELRASQWWNAVLCAGMAAVLQFLPGLAMGVLFPLLVQLTRKSAADVGRTVGNVYAWNTAGSILGATFAASVVTPAIGTAGATALAMALYFIAVLVLLPRRGGRAPWLWTGTALAGGIIVLLAAIPQDPRRTNMGTFLYGPETVASNANAEVLQFEEGAACNVLTVDNKGHRFLKVNGKTDASTGSDMTTQLGSAYLPLFVRPEAKTILVVGFGSGTTPGAALLFNHADVTCCEIEPAVYTASRHFAAVNHSPEKAKRFTMVIDDGRSYLTAVDRKFDLILSEPSNPWIAGCAALFTQQFYETVRDRLKPQGALAQWIQAYNFSPTEYALVVRTLREVFPHYALFTTQDNYSDTLLVASMAPLDLSKETVAGAQAVVNRTPAIRNDLRRYFGTSSVALVMLRHHLMEEGALDRLLALDGRSTINTDGNMRLEFDAPLRLFGKPSATTALALLEAVDATWPLRLATKMGMNTSFAPLQLEIGGILEKRRQMDAAIAAYREAIRLQPKLMMSYYRLGLALTTVGRYEEAVQACHDALKQTPDDVQAITIMAQAFEKAGDAASAIAQYRRVMELKPDARGPANNLAWLLATQPNRSLRNGAEAVRLAERAAAASKYAAPEALDTLAAAYAETGNYPKAVEFAEKAHRLFVDAGLSAEAEAISTRLRNYQSGQPFRESVGGARQSLP